MLQFFSGSVIILVSFCPSSFSKKKRQFLQKPQCNLLGVFFCTFLLDIFRWFCSAQFPEKLIQHVFSGSSSGPSRRFKRVVETIQAQLLSTNDQPGIQPQISGKQHSSPPPTTPSLPRPSPPRPHSLSPAPWHHGAITPRLPWAQHTASARGVSSCMTLPCSIACTPTHAAQSCQCVSTLTSTATQDCASHLSVLCRPRITSHSVLQSPENGLPTQTHRVGWTWVPKGLRLLHEGFGQSLRFQTTLDLREFLVNMRLTFR